MRPDELFDHAWSLSDEASLLSCRPIVLTDGSRFGEVESWVPNLPFLGSMIIRHRHPNR